MCYIIYILMRVSKVTFDTYIIYFIKRKRNYHEVNK